MGLVKIGVGTEELQVFLLQRARVTLKCRELGMHSLGKRRTGKKYSEGHRLSETGYKCVHLDDRREHAVMHSDKY